MAVTPGSENPQYISMTTESFNTDQLIAGRFPLTTAQGALLSGAAIQQRGTVLGQVATTGLWIKSVKTAGDGSQVPAGVLADYADATGGNVPASIYLTGEFNGNALIYDASWTIAALTPALRPNSILIRSVLSAGPAAYNN